MAKYMTDFEEHIVKHYYIYDRLEGGKSKHRYWLAHLFYDQNGGTVGNRKAGWYCYAPAITIHENFGPWSTPGSAKRAVKELLKKHGYKQIGGRND